MCPERLPILQWNHWFAKLCLRLMVCVPAELFLSRCRLINKQVSSSASLPVTVKMSHVNPSKEKRKKKIKKEQKLWADHCGYGSSVCACYVLVRALSIQQFYLLWKRRCEKKKRTESVTTETGRRCPHAGLWVTHEAQEVTGSWCSERLTSSAQACVADATTGMCLVSMFSWLEYGECLKHKH